MAEDYLKKVKYFIRQLSPSYLVTTKNELTENLHVLNHPELYPMEVYQEAEEVSEAFFHPEFLRWCEENEMDPMVHAKYSVGFRYFEYVPVNLWIAYAIMSLPQVPFLKLSSPVRGVLYNMINRMYCITFDYQHRNPTPDELHDYGELSFSERIMKSYKDDMGEDVWPLGIRYIGDIICVFGCSYWIYKLADMARAKITYMPKSTLSKIFFTTNSKLISPILAVSVAHAFDLIFARWGEVASGASIFDQSGMVIVNENGEKVLSKKAGIQAVFQTFQQRCLTVWCCLGAGALFESIFTHTVGMPKNPIISLALSISFLGLGLTIGVPFSLAHYDKKIYFDSTDLESQFRFLTDENGNPRKLYVYRGD
eukprot:TRINITY_DN4096_c0_g2_i1.p1 TRINITY_DN4096_c0_g2~~TRINITY_DN4096_c0_g2_i1.p1  ORF type:complete len:387 (+),score=62.29 TRINITY_DN4096_c0_g2_i1:61-1161(+)